jgi:hypothetical protein
MEEGVRMVGQVDNIPESALCLGLPVQVTYADVNDNITLPVFQARTQG